MALQPFVFIPQPSSSSACVQAQTPSRPGPASGCEQMVSNQTFTPHLIPFRGPNNATNPLRQCASAIALNSLN